MMLLFGGCLCAVYGRVLCGENTPPNNTASLGGAGGS